jgi:hypothetical protein
MKNKPPKFLICRNKLATDKVFVLHTQEPKFLAEIRKTNAMELLELQKEFPIGVQTRVDKQLWVALVLEFYDQPEVDTQATGSGGLMSRLGDWLHTYIKEVGL